MVIKYHHTTQEPKQIRFTKNEKFIISLELAHINGTVHPSRQPQLAAAAATDRRPSPSVVNIERRSVSN